MSEKHIGLPDPDQSSVWAGVEGRAANLRDMYAGSGASVVELANGEYVRRAPVFSDQVADETRTNFVSYVHGQRASRGTHAKGYQKTTLTEHEALVGLYDFLQKATAVADESIATTAGSILRNLTFIGEKEYQEAVGAIAEGWKRSLAANANSQICVVTGGLSNGGRIKSDTYMLDRVLANFTDEELVAVRGGLVQNPDDLERGNPNVDIVLLDDWTVTGMQMAESLAVVLNKHPEYAQKVKVQLMVASGPRMNRGFSMDEISFYGSDLVDKVDDGRHFVVPVCAYYRAHNAPAATRTGVHVTGAHCSSDFDFEHELARMVRAVGVDELPPLTNVVRPYWLPQYRANNIARLENTSS